MNKKLKLVPVLIYEGHYSGDLRVDLDIDPRYSYHCMVPQKVIKDFLKLEEKRKKIMELLDAYRQDEKEPIDL